MAKSIYITGIRVMVAEMKKAEKRLERAAEQGCYAGAEILRNESLRIVPVQTGFLRGSAFKPRNIGGRGFKCDIVVGYTANYAAFVHEIPNPPHAHGKAFNIKHASEIAAAGHRTKSGRWKADTWQGTTAGGMFPRGEEQQFKFLEAPLRYMRKEILSTIARYLRRA